MKVFALERAGEHNKMPTLDLSGFQDLVLIWNAFLQAILPIALIVAFIGFIAAFIGFKLLRKLGSVGLHDVSSEFKHVRRKHARTVAGLAALTLLAFSFFAVAPASGAPAAASLNVGVTQVFANTPLTVEATGLTATTAYAIYWGSTAIINWTTSAAAEDRIVTFEATPPASGNTVVLYLYQAATTSDSITMYIASVGSFLPINFFITLGVALLIIGVALMLIGTFVKRKLS